MHQKKRRFWPLLIIVACAAIPLIRTLYLLSLSPPVGYDVVDLGELGYFSLSRPAINSHGQVVGGILAEVKTRYADTTNRAFLYSNGEKTSLGTLPGGTISYAFGINDAGQIVGASDTTDGHWHTFFWEKGKMLDLQWYGDDLKINNKGQIIGWGGSKTGDQTILWSSNAKWILKDLGGGITVARSLNNKGQIVGTSETPSYTTAVMMWQGDNGQNARILTDFPNLPDLVLNSMNDYGQIVGEAGIQDKKAFLWDTGKLQYLGNLGGLSSSAQCINNKGQIVGTATSVHSIWSLLYQDERHAFVWQHGQMYDLNHGIKPDSGWVLVDATSINDAGQIVGNGTFHGQQHCFLLNPIRTNE